MCYLNIYLPDNIEFKNIMSFVHNSAVINGPKIIVSFFFQNYTYPQFYIYSWIK